MNRHGSSMKGICMNIQEIKKPLQVYMPLELLNWVQQKAKEQERSMTWIVNQALSEKRKREEMTETEVAK